MRWIRLSLVMDPIATLVTTHRIHTLTRMDPRRCVILVPFTTHIAPGCEQGLIELQRRRYEVWRVGGYANIDIGRSEMATKALALTPAPLPKGEGTNRTLPGRRRI